MANRGRGRRGRPRDNSHPPPVFDPQAFIEAIGAAVAIIVQASVVAATIARTSATVGEGGTSNLQGFQAHHPPTYMGGGDSMVRTSLAIEREVDDTRSIRDWVLVLRGRRINLLLIRERSRRLPFHGDFRDGVMVIRVKAESWLLPGHDR